MNFSSIERLGVECDSSRVAGLGTVNSDFTSKLNPGNGKYRTSIGTGQGEDILFFVIHQVKNTWGGGGAEREAESETVSYQWEPAPNWLSLPSKLSTQTQGFVAPYTKTHDC